PKSCPRGRIIDVLMGSKTVERRAAVMTASSLIRVHPPAKLDKEIGPPGFFSDERSMIEARRRRPASEASRLVRGPFHAEDLDEEGPAVGGFLDDLGRRLARAVSGAGLDPDQDRVV